MATSEVIDVQPTVTVTEDVEFKKTIEESKAKIAEAHAEKVIKRGRGRPKKISEPKPAMPTEAIGTQSQISEISPPPDLTPLIKGPLIFVSKIPAEKHKIPELALSPDEAQACAESLNQLLNAFVPDVGNMSPKTAAVVSGAMVFGSIFFQKYQIYLDKRKPLEAEPVVEVQEQNAEAQKASGIDAGAYFQRATV